MQKFNLVHDIVRERCGQKNLNVHSPLSDPLSWIREVHDGEYVDDFLEGTLTEDQQREIGLPWSEGLVERTITAVGGTLRTIDLALQEGLACNTAGGTHHAFPDHGSGFCILNDLAVGAHRALKQHDLSTILILDLDVHQGNGTAAFFGQTPSVITASLHCESNFPFEPTSGDRDIELPAGQTDTDYLLTLKEILPDLLTTYEPDLVLYDAGVDVHQGDRLGNLELTDEGIARRDRYVLESLVEREIPTACVIGGGYDENLRTLAQRHALLHEAALLVHESRCPEPDRS